MNRADRHRLCGRLADIRAFERDALFLDEIEPPRPFEREADLLAAPARVDRLRAQRAHGGDFFALTMQIFVVLDRIALTAPRTQAGAIVKLRALLDEEAGLCAGVTRVEIASLGQVLRFLGEEWEAGR